MNTIYSCGIKINPISIDEISNKTERWLRDGNKGLQITGINIEQIAYTHKFPEFKTYINNSDIVNIYGVSVYCYLKLKGYKLGGRVLCADIFHRLLENANNNHRSIYLLGATQDTIETLTQVISQKYENITIVGSHNGYFSDEQAIINDIANKHPDYLFIGMPSPFKERFITTHKESLLAGICFGVGGMFDIMAGNVKRAPQKVQQLGLEWLYRITQNPIKHTKRVWQALLPCCYVFIKNLFEPRKQTF